jgi:ribosomal protein S9
VPEMSVECGCGKRKAITAVAVVPNLGHTMISREDIARLLIAVESRDEPLHITNNIVDNTDVVHVFLAWRMRGLITR